MTERLVFNGIDASTGDYLMPPVDASVFASGALDPEKDIDHLAELRWRVRQTTETTFAPVEGVDPKDLAACGWAVVFAAGVDPAIRDALAPLLNHRQGQAGEHFRVLDFRPGETKPTFLARHGAGPGPAVPDRMPYYLLLVGDPNEIPFRVQQQLDVQYAVGRITFDKPAEYAAYARSVVKAETGTLDRPLRATFFGTATPGDRATALSSSELVSPLARSFAALGSAHVTETMIAELATKDRLRKLLSDAPSLLFTATHGVGFPSEHPSQRSQQGSILCQDWPGPGRGKLSPSCYFAASDVESSDDLTGMLMFAFACYGAGTPEFDDYGHLQPGPSKRIAPSPFVAALPQRLLANPGGGALAVVGHVDRAWGFSFTWPGVGRQTEVFESCMHRLVDGHPIGSAMEYFNDKYAELSSDLSVELEDIRYGKVSDPLALASMWTANNDARAYAIFGDPAVVLTQPRDRHQPETQAMQVRPEAPGSPSLQVSTTTGDSADLSSTIIQAVHSLTTVDVVTAEGDPGGRPDAREVRARTTVSLSGAIETVLAPGTAERDGLLRIHLAAVEAALAARAELLGALPTLLPAADHAAATQPPEADE